MEMNQKNRYLETKSTAPFLSLWFSILQISDLVSISDFSGDGVYKNQL